LLLGNGIDLIAALIGVLKAGKFFVAIDPSFPFVPDNVHAEKH
jgi:hypothetical protein